MARHVLEHDRRRGLRLIRIAGIQITIDYSWFFIFALVVVSLSAGYFPHRFAGESALMYWAAGLVATLMLFGSILVHELSHALAAQRAGIAVPEITLFLFGGVSRLSTEARDAKTEFLIAIVGPLTSFALALLFWGLWSSLGGGQPSLVSTVLAYLVWINVAVGIFNLLPGFPLDGGRVLRAIVWRATGSLTQATKIASNVGKGFAVALMILGGLQIFSGALIGGLWLIFIGMFLRGMASQGYQELVIQQSLRGVDVDEVMIQDVVSVAPDVPVQRLLTEYFLRHGYHGFPVVHAGHVRGVVSFDDVRGVPEEARQTTPVEQVMQPVSSLITIAPHTSLHEALKKMMQHHLGRLLVMQGDTLLGMVTKTGLLRFLEVKRLLQPQHT